MIGLWVRVLTIPYRYLYPAILVFICIGVYSINGAAFDVYVVLLFGAFGYAMRLLSFHVAPLLLGFVLGPMMETYFRRALVIARGDFGVFIQSPVSAVCLALTAALLLWGLASKLQRPSQARQ